MYVARSKCGECGFINYNWTPLPHCEHYLTGRYIRINMTPITIPPNNAYILALDRKRREILSGIPESQALNPEIWRY